jgi:hypothetical protein
LSFSRRSRGNLLFLKLTRADPPPAAEDDMRCHSRAPRSVILARSAGICFCDRR